MRTRMQRAVVEVAAGAMVVGLPLLGAVLAGREARELLEFPPPLEIPAGYRRFSWLAALGVIACLGLIALPWWSATQRAPRPAPPGSQAAVIRRRFPAWGLVALAWTLLWWLLAWTRWTWFEPLQRYTFFPLWLGLILTVNAVVEGRTGSCLIRRAPGRWLGLFAASAVCWWGFEWLNRFVRNWHYLAVEDFGATAYAVHATLCFSTVLPAVAAVAEWIASHPNWNRRTPTGPRWPWLGARTAAGVLFLAGMAALLGTGAWPRLCYPALWVAPLVLFLAVPGLLGRRGLAHEVAAGDWSRAATWMLAALICGLFWELWNWHSLAKWIYTVPGVERWYVFEMPLLGYAGYLPFGLECLLFAERVIGETWRPRLAGK